MRRIFFAWRMLHIIWMYMCFKIRAHICRFSRRHQQIWPTYFKTQENPFHTKTYKICEGMVVQGETRCFFLHTDALLHSWRILKLFPNKTYLKRTFLRESFPPTNHFKSFLYYVINLFVAPSNSLTRELEKNWFWLYFLKNIERYVMTILQLLLLLSFKLFITL